MSHHTLQRLIVRMLFDPAFVTKVHQNPDRELAHLDLTPTERGQLLGVDQRAWNYDPLRRLRTLRILVEEFKASTTLVLAETRSLSSLDRFFSSAVFHGSVQERGSMGLAFAQFLADGCRGGHLKTPQLPDVLRLEAEMARCRRELEQSGEPPGQPIPASINDTATVKLAAGVSVGSYQGNVIKCIQAVEKYLFEVSLMPAMVLCDDAPRLTSLPDVDAKHKCYLLCAPGTTGISLTGIERTEFFVLFEAKKSITIRNLAARVAAGGIKPHQTFDIIAQALEHHHLWLVS